MPPLHPKIAQTQLVAPTPKVLPGVGTPGPANAVVDENAIAAANTDAIIFFLAINRPIQCPRAVKRVPRR